MSNQIQDKEEKKLDYWQPLLLSIMMALGMLIGYKLNNKPDHLLSKIETEGDIKIGRVEELIRFVESRYVDTVKSEELVGEAINGILSKLDPHSAYIAPKDLHHVSENMSGQFKGIGIESILFDDTTSIITVVPNSPAALSGVLQFDKVIKINDTLVAGVGSSFEDVRRRIHALPETVKLELKRQGSPETLIKVIKLKELAMHSADVAFIVKDDIGYIQIKQFSSNTYQEFMKSFEDLYEKQKMKHLIIDVRGNPGGYLPQATKILNQLFNEKDKMLVYTIGRNKQRQDFTTNGKTFFPALNKIAVLVDEYSASGAEVIAGAIQDQDRGAIIGRRTFGKGLVQEQFGLSNGGALRLTTSKYYLPSGRNIQKQYQDLEAYENEVYQRGIFTSQKIDSTQKKYTTIKSNRAVYSGRGIDPDFFIPGDSILADPVYKYIHYYTTEYLTKKIQSKAITLQAKPDFAKLAADFIAFVAEKEKSKDIKLKYLSNASAILEKQYAYIKSNGDQDASSRYEISNDKFVKKALEYIQGKVGI